MPTMTIRNTTAKTTAAMRIAPITDPSPVANACSTRKPNPPRLRVNPFTLFFPLDLLGPVLISRLPPPYPLSMASKRYVRMVA